MNTTSRVQCFFCLCRCFTASRHRCHYCCFVMPLPMLLPPHSLFLPNTLPPLLLPSSFFFTASSFFFLLHHFPYSFLPSSFLLPPQFLHRPFLFFLFSFLFETPVHSSVLVLIDTYWSNRSLKRVRYPRRRSLVDQATIYASF